MELLHSSPLTPAVEVQNQNHWTTREVLQLFTKHFLYQFVPPFIAKCFGGSLSSIRKRRLGSVMWGSELTPMGKPLQYNYFSICSPTWQVWDLIIRYKRPSYSLFVVPSLSSGVDYLFLVGSSLFVVDGCLAVSCDYGVFVRGELKSFYFTTLSPSLTESFEVCRYIILWGLQALSPVGPR